MRFLRKLFGRMTAEDYHKEQVELITKAGRRCAHDLLHAASFIYLEPEHTEFRERAHMWLECFYPGRDGKNYRQRLHQQIAERDTYIEKLEALLAEAGIKHNHNDPRIPF